MVWHDGNAAETKALLETEEVILRGAISARLRFKDITVIRAVEGQLHLDSTVLHLGDQAEKWADKILHPPTLLDKLGVKPGMTIAVLGFTDRSFLGGIEHDICLKADVLYDAVLLHTPSLQELRALQKVKFALGPKAMLWVIYPKGRKDITQTQVFVHGKGIGMVDVKTCKFDETLTGLKFLRRKPAK